MTTNNDELEQCFNNPNEDLEVSSRKWLKAVNNVIKASFKKVRLKSTNIPCELEALFCEKENLTTMIAASGENDNVMKLKEALEITEEKIASFCAERNKDVVNHYLSLKNDEFEGFSQANTWAVSKKLSPKNAEDQPAAKRDKYGNLITDSEALKSLYLETYVDRLQPNPISEDLKDLKEMKEFLLNLHINDAKTKVTHDWTMHIVLIRL